jgi:hypothetical protein
VTVGFETFLEVGTTAPGPGIFVFGSIDPLLSGTVALTYYYDPIPEPATALLVLLGVACLGAKRRR